MYMQKSYTLQMKRMGLRFNLDVSAKRVLDEQKKNDCNVGEVMCRAFVTINKSKKNWKVRQVFLCSQKKDHSLK